MYTFLTCFRGNEFKGKTEKMFRYIFFLNILLIRWMIVIGFLSESDESSELPQVQSKMSGSFYR